MKAFLLAMAVVVLLIFGVVLIASGGNEDATKDSPNPTKELVDYADSDATVSLRIKGEINAEELHREVQVTVGRDFRRLEVIQGYQNNVIQSQPLGNNQPAFDEFLHAINLAGFTKERKSDLKSESGVCPLGRRYVFTLNQGGRDITRLWTTSCNTRGTSNGKRDLLIELFQLQIPDYDKQTAKVDL